MSGNFHHALKARSDKEGDRPFLLVPDEDAVSFAAFDALTAAIAGAFDQAGARPGDRVLMQTEKSVTAAAAFVASLRAGLVFTPLNTAYTDDETAYFIADAEPAIIIRDPARALSRPRAKGATLSSAKGALLSSAKGATLSGAKAAFTLGADGEGSLAAAARAAAPFRRTAPRDGDDLAALLYTSGTTGRSKGAMLTHANLQSNAEALVQIWEVSARDRLIHALPIFHIHGLFVAFGTALLAGAEIAFLKAFDVAAVRRAMPGASLMMGVPTFYARLLADEQFTAADAAGMRLFISGSAPLSPELHRAFADRTGKAILERYGMSEAGMIASNPLRGARLAGAVGYPLPGVAVRIRVAGEAAAADETGAVEVRGPNVCKGYWRQPEQTAQAFTPDGWFITGDMGSLSADGRLTLSGRDKDLIIVGGLNVYPAEVEAALDAVEGVAESAVVGAPHADMGEGVVAFLALAPGAVAPSAEALEAALAALARFKHPRRFIVVGSLPRNAMGKVQKNVLRAQALTVFSDQTR